MMTVRSLESNSLAAMATVFAARLDEAEQLRTNGGSLESPPQWTTREARITPDVLLCRDGSPYYQVKPNGDIWGFDICPVWCGIIDEVDPVRIVTRIYH